MSNVPLKFIVDAEDRGAGDLFDGLTRKTGTLSKAAGVAAAGGLLALGGALVGAGAAAVNTAGDFEAGMKRFESVTGDAIGDAGLTLDQFKKKFLDLGAETQFSAAQAQDAALNLAKGGVSVTDIMGGATDATLALAAAGEVELANAADIVAKQLGVWADRGVTAANVADLLAQAANASTVDVEELAGGLAQAGGVAKVTGVEYDDLLQTMALLAPGFASASDAGTSYKTFLSRLIPTTEDATGAMIDLGLATADGESKFFDANGAFIGMREAAALLHEQTKDLSEEQRALAFNTIFGSDAVRAAAMIAEQGADGFDAMGQAMDGAGSAAEQAKKRNEGFNFALDSLLGSAETFGIVAGSKLLPILTDLINDGLIPIVNVATDVVSGLGDTTTTIGSLAAFVADNAQPAIVGLTAATATYALVTMAQSLPAIGAKTAALLVQTKAIAANAAAMAAAAAPYVVVAAAVMGVVKVYTEFNEKTKAATNQLLESRDWWTDSSTAIDAYAGSTDAVKEKLGPLADQLRAVREQQQQELESLTRRMTAGQVSEEQYGREMATINARAQSIQDLTGVMDRQLAAELEAQAEAQGLISAVEAHTGAEGERREAVGLSADEMKKLIDELQKIRDESVQAMADITTADVGFLSGLEERRASHEDRMLQLIRDKNAAESADQRAAIDEKIAAEQAAFQAEEQEAALSYARQQAAQLQHLGEMLIAYVSSQEQMGRISTEKAAALTGAIRQEYGVQKSIFEETYDTAIAKIDAWGVSTDTNVQNVIGDLTDLRLSSIETQQRMDELAKEYEAKLRHDFDAGKLSAEQLALALSRIPSEVRTRVLIEERIREVRERYTDAKTAQVDAVLDGKRARGGPVDAGGLYLVGEEGPELLQMGDRGGDILPAGPTQRLLDGGGNGAATIEQNFHFSSSVSDDDMRRIMAVAEDAAKKTNGTTARRVDVKQRLAGLSIT
jgi:TP901 family phage tail tape measure protein